MEKNLFLAFGLIVVGFLLLVVEFFLPSGGILFGLSLGAIVVGVAMTFLNSTTPTVGVVTLITVFIAVPAVFSAMMHVWPRTRWGRRFFLNEPDEDATIASMPVYLELEQLRGRFGRAVSALRPAGVVDFDGRRVDTITEGMMVEPGQWVRCIDVRAGKVVVRAVEKPDLGDLEADFLA